MSTLIICSRYTAVLGMFHELLSFKIYYKFSWAQLLIKIKVRGLYHYHGLREF